MVADASVDMMISNDTVSSFEKGRVGADSTKPSPTVKVAESPSDEGYSPTGAPRGRGRAMRRSSVSSKPPEFLPLRLDREIRSKSLGRVLRKDRGSSAGETAPVTVTTNKHITEEVVNECAASVKTSCTAVNTVGVQSDMTDAKPRVTVAAAVESFTSPVKASHRTFGGPFRSPSKSPAKSPNWAHVSLKSDDYLPLRSPLNRTLDLREPNSPMLSESSSESTIEASSPVLSSKRTWTLLKNGEEEAEEPQPLDGQQRPVTVRGMSFDEEDPLCAAHGSDTTKADGHRSDDLSGHAPVTRPTTVRGHSFDALPDEGQNRGEVKRGATGDKTAKSPKRKARKGKATKKGKSSAKESETVALPAVELSPNVDDGAVSPSKVRPLKVRTLPVEAELLGLSELELDESPTQEEAPNQSVSVVVAQERSKATGKLHVTQKTGSGVKAATEKAVADASTGKSRVGRKPRPQEPSSQMDEDEDSCEVRIELVKEEEEEKMLGIKEAPRLTSNSIRPTYIRGLSMSDDAPVDTPTEESKPTRPRGGRKARPSANACTKPATETISPQPAVVDHSNDGVLKPVSKPVVSNGETIEREPEWTKPKLKSASRCDPNEKEKQIAWAKPTWSINRSRDLQHPKISDDDTTEVSESVTEPQD
jgi:hypothetical protein